jgi:tetratricopeptide (TPR) repeat protein
VATTPLREALQHAEAEINAGRPGEALRSCDQLLGKHPRWLEAQRLRAKALVAIDRLPEAEQLLDGILACHPEDVDAFCDRAYLAQRKGDAIGALACYRRACELARNNGQLRALHNQLAAQLGRPPYTPSHTGLARLYQRAELFAHAVREWDIALQANPKRLDAQIGMAETLWRMGDARRAQEVCRYILRHMPTCLKPMLLLVLFELDSGHQEEAQRLTQMAGELDPEQRVAGELFGDLVATGHAALAQLFRLAVKTQTTPLVAPGDSQVGALSAIGLASRAGQFPLPAGQLPTGPLFLRPQTHPLAETEPTNKLEMPAASANGNGHGNIEDFFSRSRASMLPDEFGHVFKETEYMLWSRDNEEPITAEITTITSDTPPPIMPEEADMRFIRWLQEQGARPLGESAVTPVPLAPLPPAETVPVPPFLAQAIADSMEVAAVVEPMVPVDEDALPTATVAPSPPPVPAEADASWPSAVIPAAPPPTLREETVESAPETEILASVVVPAADTPTVPIVEAEGVSVPLTPFAMTTVPTVLILSEPPAPIAAVSDSNITVPEVAPVTPADSFTPASSREATAPPATSQPAADAPPMTMEAIQQGLESAGFARLDTGRLASVASSLGKAPEEADLAPMDINQHLATARDLRRQGRMGEALVEYRALVKAATDRMPEIIRDLRDAAIEAPREPEIYRLQGDAYIRQGDYVEALEAYNHASALRTQTG